VRHREAAERTLLTAIATGAVPAEGLLAAATERAYTDTGHALDFVNKAFECLDLIGWQCVATVLPTVVGQMVAARGAEEATAWRHPVDLIALCEESAEQLSDLSRLAAACLAGPATKRSPETCSVTIHAELLRPSTGNARRRRPV
jgi:hypothetical protein